MRRFRLHSITSNLVVGELAGGGVEHRWALLRDQDGSVFARVGTRAESQSKICKLADRPSLSQANGHTKVGGQVSRGRPQNERVMRNLINFKSNLEPANQAAAVVGVASVA